MKFENNYKDRNILITALSRKEYARTAHLKTAHAIWKKLCDYNEGTNEIKSMHLDTYTREYQMFRQHPSESLDSVVARFDNTVSNLYSCGDLAFTDNQIVRQLLYSRDDSIWGVKISALEEASDFATFTCEKLFSKLKTHEIAKKSRANTENPSSSCE